MTYETIDWDAEAKRVADAFDVTGDCEFVENMDGQAKPFRELVNASNRSRPQTSSLFLSVYYRPNSFTFGLIGTVFSGVRITETGTNTSMDTTHIPQIAKALYHLSLLSPEVELALGVTITAHQKMEWELEYQGRGGG